MSRLSECILVVGIGLVLAGCDRPEESLDDFRKRWSHAASNGEAGGLYLTLDSASQRIIREELQVIRGLDSASQRAVLDQLGKPPATALADLSPQRYFALLWSRATQERKFDIQIEVDGPGVAFMRLAAEDESASTGDAQPLYVALVNEGGQWRWRLPQQGLATAAHSVIKENRSQRANTARTQPRVPPRRNRGVPPRAAW